MTQPTGPKRKVHAVPQEHDDTDPLERIAATKGRLEYWERELKEAVREARRRGRTWRQIGRALGVSPQAATLRFGPGGAMDVEAGNR